MGDSFSGYSLGRLTCCICGKDVGRVAPSQVTCGEMACWLEHKKRRCREYKARKKLQRTEKESSDERSSSER